MVFIEIVTKIWTNIIHIAYIKYKKKLYYMTSSNPFAFMSCLEVSAIPLHALTEASELMSDKCQHSADLRWCRGSLSVFDSQTFSKLSLTWSCQQQSATDAFSLLLGREHYELHAAVWECHLERSMKCRMILALFPATFH